MKYRILKKEGNFLLDNGYMFANDIETLRFDFPLPWYIALNTSIPKDLSTKDIIDNTIVDATTEVLTARNNKRLEDLAISARSKRDLLLLETDKYMTIDYPQTDEKRDEFVIYRQLLRDLTNQPEFPESINWPIKPEL